MYFANLLRYHVMCITCRVHHHSINCHLHYHDSLLKKEAAASTLRITGCNTVRNPNYFHVVFRENMVDWYVGMLPFSLDDSFSRFRVLEAG
jgi:hypothetical protein